MRRFICFLKDEDANIIVEYALLSMLVAAACIPALKHVGLALAALFNDIAMKLTAIIH